MNPIEVHLFGRSWPTIICSFAVLCLACGVHREPDDASSDPFAGSSETGSGSDPASSSESGTSDEDASSSGRPVSDPESDDDDADDGSDERDAPPPPGDPEDTTTGAEEATTGAEEATTGAEEATTDSPDPSTCGDGVLDADEICDDGNTVTELACPDRDACSACRADCAAELAIPASDAAIQPQQGTSVALETFSDDVLGWRFAVGETDVVVTELGFFDLGRDGLGDDHDVGIYEADSGTLVASGTVPAGTDTFMEGPGFRYVPITPVVLSASRTYLVVGYRPTTADTALVEVASFETPPYLEYLAPVGRNATSGLVFSNDDTPDANGYFGPTFRAIARVDP